MSQSLKSNATGLVLSSDFSAHQAQGLPEKPARIEAIRRGLAEANLLEQLVMVEPPAITNAAEKAAILGWIKTNHDPDYIDTFEKAFASGASILTTSDTPLCQATFDVTWQATGAVLRTVEQVATGALKNGFCTVRPPGHHAEHAAASGFCYVNHVAVAARYLLLNENGFVQPSGEKLKIDRVLIVDVDLHHGNGAQHSFWDDPRVMFCSLHGDPQYLHYPGFGRERETGKHGNILNIPLLPETGTSHYLKAFEKRFLDAAEKFHPQFVLVSAGFDTHRLDPFDYMRLNTDDFKRISKLLVDLANRQCEGRLVSILEGGYNLSVLGESVAAHVEGLLEG